MYGFPGFDSALISGRRKESKEQEYNDGAGTWLQKVYDQCVRVYFDSDRSLAKNEKVPVKDVMSCTFCQQN